MSIRLPSISLFRYLIQDVIHIINNLNKDRLEYSSEITRSDMIIPLLIIEYEIWLHYTPKLPIS